MRRGKLTFMALYPSSDWTVASMRFTAFPVTPERPADHHWWRDVMNQEPEARTVKTTPVQIEESGPFNDLSRVVLSVTTARTDLVLIPNPTPSLLPDAVGTLPDIQPRFIEIALRWLALSNRFPIQRLAFGAVLFHQEQNRKAGYERVGQFLAHTLTPSDRDSRDLFFQINWPVVSTSVPELVINRLTKWAVLAARGIAITPSGVTSSPPEAWATTLEIDFSTAAETAGPLPNAQVEALLAELVSAAMLVAAEGDKA